MAIGIVLQTVNLVNPLHPVVREGKIVNVVRLAETIDPDLVVTIANHVVRTHRFSALSENIGNRVSCSNDSSGASQVGEVRTSGWILKSNEVNRKNEQKPRDQISDWRDVYVFMLF